MVRGMYLKSKQPVQKKDGYSKALKHTPPQLAQSNEMLTVESSEILHLEESRSMYKNSTGDESSLNISRADISVENSSFYNKNKSFQGSPQITIGLNPSSPIPSPNPGNNLTPYQVNVQPGRRPSRNVDNDHVVLSAQPYSSPKFLFPSQAYQAGQANSRRPSHHDVENNSGNNLTPNYRIYQHQQNILNVNLTVNYSQGGGGHPMNNIPSPQGPIANGMRINRIKRRGGKIKMPT